MTNREIAELMFSKMKSFGFTPYDISYGDGYFLFEMGEDSVVHFKIKEVWKNWKFGMWINSEELNNYNEEENKDTPYEKEPNVVQIFCQHEHLLDKFKPSRSALCVDIKPCDFEDDDIGWGSYELKDMLKMIKYHPIMCWNEFCGHAGYYDRKSFLIPFLKYESEYVLKEIVERVILLEKEVDELKAYNMRRCNNCKYVGKSIDDEPCYDCARKFTDHWERG